MNIMEIVRVSLSSLLANKLRSLLTMLGIIIGVGAVIAIVAIGKGSTASVEQAINKMGNNVIIVYADAPYVPSANWMNMYDASRMTMDDAQRIEKLDSVAGVAPKGASTSAKVARGKQNYDIQVEGTLNRFDRVFRFKFAQGRSFTDYETQHGMNVVILESEAAKRLFPGDKGNLIGQKIQINRVPYTVIGVLEKLESFNTQNDQLYIPITTMKNRFGAKKFDMMYISAKSPELIDKANSEIGESLRLQRKLKLSDAKNFRIETQKEYLEQARGVNRIMTNLLQGVAAISLLIGGVGIMNIMIVSVTERTREIGIRKAIGAGRRHIMTQFLAEAVILSMLGGVIGILFGIGAAALLEKFAALPIVHTLPPVLLSFLSAVGIGILFGVYPAFKASRLKPIDALSYE
ncbi:ABC transporter permease [Paenibacillus sp.]|jgi:putative ABC transport system permease protein|uniref:ABC transporter permease n=1 Tax=Paenibacillus sp. TaxID=58172 RepID=UPI002834E821|nr:ABC transporter permease [Paenibacillus sp.]MDR0268613.1 ABC transporter permease [Paenibacillus sp.]